MRKLKPNTLANKIRRWICIKLFWFLPEHNIKVPKGIDEAITFWACVGLVGDFD